MQCNAIQRALRGGLGVGLVELGVGRGPGLGKFEVVGVALVLEVLAVNGLDGVDAAGVNFSALGDGVEIGEVFGVNLRGVYEKLAAKADVGGFADGVEVLVEVVDDRDARGALDLANSVDRDLVEVLHDASDDVVMGRDEDARAAAHRGHDGVLPVREDALLAHAERLARRVDVGSERLVSPVPARPERVILPHRDGRLVEAAAELLQELLAHLSLHLLLRHALERAVVPLVESPRPLHLDPVLIARVQHRPERPDRPLQQGGVRLVELEPVPFQHQSRVNRLIATLL
mmetsp:Transcript_19306/g.60738  ORF Transcript_19306/g.60738 Transcript_19306/m.60738 type:complete len:288 (+) Transcript_19306:232-1095(+)